MSILTGDVEIRATHPYGYRNGQWALIIDVEWIKNRPCYRVRFSDGAMDCWPINDPLDHYEFREYEIK